VLQRSTKEGMIVNRTRWIYCKEILKEFWAFEDVIHLGNYILIKYKPVYVSSLLLT